MHLYIFIAFFVSFVAAKTHRYDFNVTYVRRNPDGLHERRLIGINNQWPIPSIRVKPHDRVIINVDNQLDQNTSLHFHGLFLENQNYMDGPQQVTQCPIPPGHKFVYNFTIGDQAGTYWYHSHSGAQYSDGLRGLFIIEDETLPEHDEELSITLSDFYHEEAPQIMKRFLNKYNPTGAEPVPQNALVNDTKNVTWAVRADTNYLVRFVNMGLFVSQYVYFEDHVLTIVEVDGVRVEPQEVDSLYISVAQRYTVLLQTKNTSKNYRFVNIIDQELLDVLPEDLEVISTNYMVYDKNSHIPHRLENGPNKFESAIEKLNPYDDFNLKPLSKTALYDDYDYQIQLNFTMDNLGDGVNYAFFNNLTYVPPKVPTLMSVLSAGEFANSVGIYGSNTHTYILQKDEVVEIVLNNMDPGKHPFHLHGHIFQILSRSPEGEDDDPILYDDSNPEHTKFPSHPMMRDTVMVNPNGFIVLRFKADNPGVWFFHCHVDWHLEQGLAITLVESPMDILAMNLSIPQSHWDACRLLNLSSYGNAAGNFGPTESDWLDLAGELVQVKPLPEGFTMKGYVAFALCSLLALYGLFSIYRYGIEDVDTQENEETMKKLYAILSEHQDNNQYALSTRESETEPLQPNP